MQEHKWHEEDKDAYRKCASQLPRRAGVPGRGRASKLTENPGKSAAVEESP